jgi:hypothetical protein
MGLSRMWFLCLHGRLCSPAGKSELMVSLLHVFQIINGLDLVTLSIAIWTVWTAFSLSLGGTLQRAFRLIALGALAFALSHIVDALVAELRLLPTQTALLFHQSGVLIATLLFVMGIGRLTASLSLVSASQRETSSSLLWPLSIGIMTFVVALSFILYGLSLEAAAVAFIGTNCCLLFVIGVSCVLLARARIGGAIGRSLWLAFVGLLCFGLAHPLQAWTLFENPSAPAENALLHRLIVVPAFLLFAFSLTSLARALSRTSIRESMASMKARGRRLPQTPAPARPGHVPGARPGVQPPRRPSPVGWRSPSGFPPFEPRSNWPG